MSDNACSRQWTQSFCSSCGFEESHQRNKIICLQACRKVSPDRCALGELQRYPNPSYGTWAKFSERRSKWCDSKLLRRQAEG